MDYHYSKYLILQVLRVVRKIKRLLKPNPNKFLKEVSGLIHIGANTGQEIKKYDSYELAVIWIEPIPSVYEQLKDNIKDYKKQQAFRECITDVDGRHYEFHIANNGGASSSIYELKHHKDMWPDIIYEQSILVNSITLTSLVKRESIDMNNYQALIMDVQGSELLVLKGSIPLLKHVKYIQAEVANFELYEGCCQLPEMIDFMTEHGFEEYHRDQFAQRIEGGSCYDVTFKKADGNT